MGISSVRNLIALFALWSSACSVAYASDWRHLAQDEKYIYSIDMDSIAFGTIIEVWFKTDYINDFKGTYQTMEFVRFDCKSRRYSIDRMIAFNKNGEKNDWNPGSGWKSPAPDTMMDSKMKLFCKR